ncbi:hypothetical protein [Microcoleus sp. herbarium12]|uniref:hypothetical protein n=1 Tax=Microcoleus sp. herbarium12 TaxID=3055437 RepID=UPI002FD4D445
MLLSQWYYDIQDAIASLQEFPYRCSVAPEAAIIGREIRQLWVGKGRTHRILFVWRRIPSRSYIFVTVVKLLLELSRQSNRIKSHQIVNKGRSPFLFSDNRSSKMKERSPPAYLIYSQQTKSTQQFS